MELDPYIDQRLTCFPFLNLIKPVASLLKQPPEGGGKSPPSGAMRPERYRTLHTLFFTSKNNINKNNFDDASFLLYNFDDASSKL